jgi:hypothetical protein
VSISANRSAEHAENGSAEHADNGSAEHAEHAEDGSAEHADNGSAEHAEHGKAGAQRLCYRNAAAARLEPQSLPGHAASLRAITSTVLA